MRLLISALLLFVSLATSARAEELYVELGRTPTEAEAKAMWTDLSGKFPKILGRYTVFPNQILQSDGSSAYRVQAGPMVDKKEAQRVCNRLYRRKIECFVIEGFDPKNPQTFNNPEKTAPKIGFADFVLPWLSSAKPEAPAVPAEPTPAPAPVEAAPPSSAVLVNNAKGKVDIAEAIPVPVSETNEVTVGEATPISSSDDAKPVDTPTPGWLSIKPFLDEERARDFWAAARKREPGITKGLTIKLVHPLVSHDIPKVILAIGRFDSETEAMKFCRNQTMGSSELECRFAAEPPEGEDPVASISKSLATGDADEYSLFWVEVLDEKSQDKALEKWEKIRTDNDDLLADVRSQITSSFANPGHYMVRIGPLKAKSKASVLCEALKARKINCRLASL